MKYNSNQIIINKNKTKDGLLIGLRKKSQILTHSYMTKMSDSYNEGDEGEYENGIENEEEIKSPAPFVPPNSSPNTSSGVNDDVFAFPNDPVIPDNHMANTFEDDSINPMIPSEMPSKFLHPTDFNNIDTMDSEKMSESGMIKEVLEQIEQEHKNERSGSDSDDTVTSPHPASQIEFENNKVDDGFEVNHEGERTSNYRQRYTPMPPGQTDPAEDTRDPYMVRKHNFLIFGSENIEFFKNIACLFVKLILDL